MFIVETDYAEVRTFVWKPAFLHTLKNYLPRAIPTRPKTLKNKKRKNVRKTLTLFIKIVKKV